jgi:beta-mannanase
MLGAFAPGGTARGLAGSDAGSSSLESGIGRRLNLVQVYYAWGASFPGQTEQGILAQGQTPLISWNGTDTASIVSGSQDGLIRQRAAGVAGLGQTVLLRWFWEMDGKKKAGWAGSPASFIAAWQHIHDLFAQVGVRNAEWVWCPTAYGVQKGVAQAFYPGDQYVEWMCADGYNKAPGPTMSGFPTQSEKPRSFADIYSAWYAWAMPHRKPLIVGEFGCQVQAPGGRPAWLNAAHTALKSQFPGIKAVVYFDAVDNTSGYDWRLDGDSASLQAFQAMAT